MQLITEKSRRTREIYLVYLQNGPKMRPLCLTAHIFKIYEPICMIFGRHQRYFVVKTTVNFILNKFITQGANPLTPDLHWWLSDD